MTTGKTIGRNALTQSLKSISTPFVFAERSDHCELTNTYQSLNFSIIFLSLRNHMPSAQTN